MQLYEKISLFGYLHIDHVLKFELSSTNKKSKKRTIVMIQCFEYLLFQSVRELKLKTAIATFQIIVRRRQKQLWTFNYTICYIIQ